MTSVPSKPSQKKSKLTTWGTPASYFPVPLHTSRMERQDLAYSLSLTAEQRISWLIMMQELLLKQFKKAKS